jgi:steroid 5-alpha reductase family enzyme
MQEFMTILGWNLAAVTTMMFIGWLISLLFRNVTVVDSLWGLGFVLVAWLTCLASTGYGGRSTLLTILVTLWGLRLSIYLSARNWGKGEDPRYGSWRKKSGRKFWLVSLFKVFILQALFLWIISLVLQAGQLTAEPAAFTWLDFSGTLVWVAGFLFESIGDWQLARFKSDPANKNRVMKKGLWAYSRHPNYFGEFLVWWGIFIITLSSPSNWWTILSPMVVTAVLLKMTGIPLTEKELIEKRAGYADYVKRTNAFIPWRPAKESK